MASFECDHLSGALSPSGVPEPAEFRATTGDHHLCPEPGIEQLDDVGRSTPTLRYRIEAALRGIYDDSGDMARRLQVEGMVSPHSTLSVHFGCETLRVSSLSWIDSPRVVGACQVVLSDLTSVDIVESQNASITVPPFEPGTHDAIHLVAAKVDGTQPTRVALRARSAIGSQATLSFEF